mgnify:CR=1 FL=1
MPAPVHPNGRGRPVHAASGTPAMLAFIGRRLLVAIPTILLISIFVFLLQQLLQSILPVLEVEE